MRVLALSKAVSIVVCSLGITAAFVGGVFILIR